MTKMITTVKSQVRSSIERRSAHKQLRRELATYSTQSEINDLLAAFAKDDTPQAEEVRMLLAENRRSSMWFPYAA